MFPKYQPLDINKIGLVCFNPVKQDIKKIASDVPPCDYLIAGVCKLYRLLQPGFLSNFHLQH